MRLEHSEHLASAIVEFCRFLRTHGFSADTRQTMTALEAAGATNFANLRIFLPTLKTTLCSTPEEWEQFPRLFQAFWGETAPGPRSASGEHTRPPKDDTGTRREGSSVFLDSTGNQNAAQDGNAKAVHGASAQQRLKKVDFSELPSEDLAQLEEISLRLTRRMSLRLSRRLLNSNHAYRIDLRRTIRRSIALGGEPLVLAYKSRKTRKNKLVILLDVSGSMNFYSLFFVRFAYALQTHFQHVHTFLFSTDVVEISDLLRTQLARRAATALARAAGWSSGTKSANPFKLQPAPRKKAAHTRHDLHHPERRLGYRRAGRARSAIAISKRRVQKVLWLNPAPGIKGLSARNPRHGGRASLRRYLCSST